MTTIESACQPVQSSARTSVFHSVPMCVVLLFVCLRNICLPSNRGITNEYLVRLLFFCLLVFLALDVRLLIRLVVRVAAKHGCDILQEVNLESSSKRIETALH